jgi:hypothetical protein
MKLSESVALALFSAKVCGVNVAMATMLPAVPLLGYVPEGVRSGSADVYESSLIRGPTI